MLENPSIRSSRLNWEDDYCVSHDFDRLSDLSSGKMDHSGDYARVECAGAFKRCFLELGKGEKI